MGDGPDHRIVVNSFPLHRGSRTVSGPTPHASNAALLIDFDNVTLGVRSDLTKELRHLLDSDIIKGKVSVQRAYADWRRYPQYIVPLSESSIDLIFAPAFGTNKKNATDIRLAIDATELVFTRPEIGTFILLSGDSDFSSLVIKLKEYGKYVIGVGIRESASDILIQNCDEYYSYTDLAGLTREADVPSTQRDPWELVVEAVQQMIANRDVMRADRLKQVMQQIDTNFDESNAGFNRFSKFVQEAGSRGLITVAKMENGQYEVGPAKGGSAAPGSATKAGGEPASGEGSRRSRGRGRGRNGGAPAAPAATAKPTTEEVAAPPAEPATKSEASDADKDRRRRRRGGRGRSRSAEEREATPRAAEPREEHELTLAEAFHLLTRALGELPAPVPHDTLRARMAALHGREDPLLESAAFPRLLRQANDAEVADVRQVSEGEFEVSPHKTDLAMQMRPVAEATNGATAPTAQPSRPAAALRFRSGSQSSKRAGQVAMVGVIKLDGDSETKPDTAAEAEAEAAPKVEESKSTKSGRRSRAKKAASSGETGKEPAKTTKSARTTKSAGKSKAATPAAKPAAKSTAKSAAKKAKTAKRSSSAKRKSAKAAKTAKSAKSVASDSDAG